MRFVSFALLSGSLLLVACARVVTTGLSVVGPATMSIHAEAELLVGSGSDVGVPRPATFRRLLVPPECDVDIDDEGPTRDPGIRVSARVPGPCAFSLEVDDGVGWPRRVDLTIRFLDVATLRPLDEAHWTDACPAAVRAERFGDAVACEAGGEVVVRDGRGVERLPGELRATDGAGGWWVCTDSECRVRGEDGVFRVAKGIATKASAILPIRSPPGTFLVTGFQEAHSVAELVHRETGAALPLRDLPAGLLDLHVTAGSLFGVGFDEEGAVTAWGFVDGDWVSWGATSIAPDTFLGLEEPIGRSRGGGAFLVGIERSRLVAGPLDLGWNELSSGDRGIPGSRLFLLRRGASVELGRLTPQGWETVALAPWSVAKGTWRSVPALVTDDVVAFPVGRGGGVVTRYSISR